MKSAEVIKQEKATKILKEFSQTERTFLDNMAITVRMLNASNEPNGSLPPALKRLLVALTSLEQSGASFFPMIENAETLLTEQTLTQEQLKIRQDKLNSVFVAHASFIANAAIAYSACLKELEQNPKVNEALSKFLQENNINHQISALFIMPVQRTPRYRMLIEELIKNGDATSLLLVPSIEHVLTAADRINTGERANSVETAIQAFVNSKKGLKKGLLTLVGANITAPQIEALSAVHNELRYAELNNYVDLINKDLIRQAGFADPKELKELKELIPVSSTRDKQSITEMRDEYQLLFGKAYEISNIMKTASNANPLIMQRLQKIKKDIEKAEARFSSQNAKMAVQNKEKYDAYLKAYQARIKVELDFINKKLTQLYIADKNKQYETLKARVQRLIGLLRQHDSAEFTANSTTLKNLLASPDLTQKDAVQLQDEYQAAGLGLDDTTISEYADFRRKHIESIKEQVQEAFPDYVFPMPEQEIENKARTEAIRAEAEHAAATRAETKHHAEELETEQTAGLAILEDTANKAKLILGQLNEWLNANGNDRPAFETFGKYLTAAEQKEFIEWINEVMPAIPNIIPGNKAKTMDELITYCNSPRGKRHLQRELVVLKQKITAAELAAKTPEERANIQKTKSFVRLLFETSTQYLQSGFEDKGAGVENRDQICIDAGKRFCDNPHALNTSEKMLYDSNLIFSSLASLESYYQTAKSSKQEGAVEGNLKDQASMANALVKLFIDLVNKYPQDASLKSLATIVDQINDAIPEPATSTSIYEILAQNIEYLNGLRTLNADRETTNKELSERITNAITAYTQCLEQYRSLAISDEPKDAKKAKLRQINQMLLSIPSDIFDRQWIRQQGFVTKGSVTPFVGIVTPYKLSAIELTSEPFAGYTRVKKKVEADAGKQAKSDYAGFYTSNATGKRYYIKKSKEFPSDDIAERLASTLLGFVIGEQAVSYITVPTKQDPSVIYLASEVSLPTLKSKVKPDLKVLGIDLPGADLPSAKKTIVYNALTPAQRKGVAKILAACLWVNNNDCQIANILLDKDHDNTKVFDFGWALANICKDGHEHVKLFERIFPRSFEDVGMHPAGSFVPTNHFNDYPDIINSQDFVDALSEILPTITNEQITKQIESTVDQAIKEYKNIGEREALSLFAVHIGILPIGKEFAETLAISNIKQQIKMHLTKRLEQRANSMAVLKCMLQMDLALKETPPEPNTIADILQELKGVLFRFDITNPLTNTVGKMFPPPYQDQASTLFSNAQAILNTLQSEKSSDTVNDMKAYCTFMSQMLSGELEESDWQARQHQVKRRRQSTATMPSLSKKIPVFLHLPADMELKMDAEDASVPPAPAETRGPAPSGEEARKTMELLRAKEAARQAAETEERMARARAAATRAETAAAGASMFAERAEQLAKIAKEEARKITPPAPKKAAPPRPNQPKK